MYSMWDFPTSQTTLCARPEQATEKKKKNMLTAPHCKLYQQQIAVREQALTGANRSAAAAVCQTEGF